MSVASPTNKEEFKKYIKTQLGEPVIEVNVHDDQLEVRIQEAIDLFTEYHHDGTEHVFIGHKLSEADQAKGFIMVPEWMFEVIRVLSFGATNNPSSSGSDGEDLIFTHGSSQISLWGGNIAGGYGTMDPGVGGSAGNGIMMFLMDQQQAYRDSILFHEDSVRFNKHTKRIQLDVGKGAIVPGQYVVYEGFASLQGLDESRMWNDNWLKRYATALVKLQWGINLTKFTGGTLFGGEIQVNGEKIHADAVSEVEKLKDELMTNYTAQPMMWVG